MNHRITYIHGLFENADSYLYREIQRFLEEQKCAYEGVELYQRVQFGSYSFQKEVERIEEIVHRNNPTMIIAHSLGAYVALQLQNSYPLLLVEPSLAIADIVIPNIRYRDGTLIYDDGQSQVELSPEFVESLSLAPSIEKAAQHAKKKDIHIVGAGRGGYLVAGSYHSCIGQSSYTLLPNSDHAFSDKKGLDDLFEIIKQRL
ncbi:MAG: hypothetical protein V1707_01565 [bacterium]